MKQKFQYGDLVKVAKDLGPSMSHFTADCDAIVIGSYADQFGGDNTKDYTLHLKDRGTSSWYKGHQLTLIKHNQEDLLKRWENEANAESEMKANLDWIFANGEELFCNPHGASIHALAACFGVTNLSGSHGEGFVYFENMLYTLDLVSPFLITEDKEGWLKKAEEIKIELAKHNTRRK